MDWDNNVHMLYRIILKLGGSVKEVVNNKDGTYTVTMSYPLRGYIVGTDTETCDWIEMPYTLTPQV